jgi:hypothetical protein
MAVGQSRSAYDDDDDDDDDNGMNHHCHWLLLGL